MNQTETLLKEMNMNKNICPDCGGSGMHIKLPVHDIHGHCLSRLQWDDCLACNGTGELPNF